jgi:hypothetical protein
VVLTEVPSSEDLKYPPLYNRNSENNFEPIPVEDWEAYY